MMNAFQAMLGGQGRSSMFGTSCPPAVPKLHKQNSNADSLRLGPPKLTQQRSSAFIPISSAVRDGEGSGKMQGIGENLTG